MAELDWAAANSGQKNVRDKYPEIFGGEVETAPNSGSRETKAPTVSEEPTAPVPATAPAPARNEADLPREAYADMPLSEVGSRALSNALPSAGNALKGMYDAVVNYEDTASTLNELGKGVVSKVRGAFGGERNAEAEAVADALGAMYADRYGSMAGFKETLAEDPASIGMDLASVAPVAGVAGRAAGLGPVATGLQKVAALGDPLTLAAKTAQVGSRAAMLPVTTVGRYAQGAASGTPLNALKLAEQAGRSRDPLARAAFTNFAMGRGEPRDIARLAMDAMNEKVRSVHNFYTRQKQALTTQELSLADVRRTIDDLRSQLNQFGTRSGMPDVDALKRMDDLVRAYEAHPDPASRTAVSLDRLKRDLRQIVNDVPASERGSLAVVPRSVRDTIAGVDPTYAQMMDYWQDWMAQMKDLQSTLGTGDRVTETSRLNKLLSTMKSDSKMSLLKELTDTQAGKYLPYMIAGASVEKLAPPYLQGTGLAGLGMLAAGGPHGILAAAAGSPRVSGLTQYAAGRIPAVAGNAAGYAGMAAPATNLLSQIGQDRMGRKSGGRVGIDHDHLADQLVGAAERAKKGISKETEALLDVHDDHIAHALEVANRSI